MFIRVYWYLPVIFICLLVVGCKMASNSIMDQKNAEKVDFKLSGNKQTGIQINN